MEITGPRIIQNLIFNKLKIINKDGCLIGTDKPQIYLQNTDYEFVYSNIGIKETKIKEYKLLQDNNNKLPYQYYNYI